MLKEPDFLLKLEEPPFAGFAVDDGLLDIIENKKKCKLSSYCTCIYFNVRTKTSFHLT